MARVGVSSPAQPVSTSLYSPHCCGDVAVDITNAATTTARGAAPCAEPGTDKSHPLQALHHYIQLHIITPF